MAPYDGTQQWHRVHSPKVGRHLPPPTMAHYNGTLQWPCNGTLVPRPICQNGSSPSPLLEVRTPIAISIWGKNHNDWPWKCHMENWKNARSNLGHLEGSAAAIAMNKCILVVMHAMAVRSSVNHGMETLLWVDSPVDFRDCWWFC